MRGKIPPRGMHEIGNFYQFQNAVGQFSSHIVLAFIFITYSKGYLVIYILICTQISRSFHNYETVYIYIYIIQNLIMQRKLQTVFSFI